MSLSDILKKFEGKTVKITYHSGAAVFSRDIELYPKEGDPEFILCGPSDFVTSQGENISTPSECILPVTNMKQIKEVLRKTEAEKGVEALIHNF